MKDLEAKICIITARELSRLVEVAELLQTSWIPSRGLLLFLPFWGHKSAFWLRRAGQRMNFFIFGKPICFGLKRVDLHGFSPLYTSSSRAWVLIELPFSTHETASSFIPPKQTQCLFQTHTLSSSRYASAYERSLEALRVLSLKASETVRLAPACCREQSGMPGAHLYMRESALSNPFYELDFLFAEGDLLIVILIIDRPPLVFFVHATFHLTLVPPNQSAALSVVPYVALLIVPYQGYLSDCKMHTVWDQISPDLPASGLVHDQPSPTAEICTMIGLQVKQAISWDYH